MFISFLWLHIGIQKEIVQIDNHIHPLKFSQRKNWDCGICGKNYRSTKSYFCGACKYDACSDCVTKTFEGITYLFQFIIKIFSFYKFEESQIETYACFHMHSL